jgi:DNA-binding transcriptional regulator GbsR (MarR family)
MARVHALLIVSDDPLGLDEIADELGISRGNASMCLKELRSWGVVQRVHVKGSRRDLYVTEEDVWSMFFRILVERKRREFDPALAAVRDALNGLGADRDDRVQARLGQMEDLLSTMDRVAARVLTAPGSSRTMLKFLAGISGSPEE